MNELQRLIDKEAIRDLVLNYSRGVDRQDMVMLRDLYTADATDTHGDTFDGSADDYVAFLARSLPYIKYSGHHVCNHLISVDGDEAEGEVYAIAIHVIPDGQGGVIEDTMCVRYIDRYKKESDGEWRFAQRVVTYDYRARKPVEEASVNGLPSADQEPSYHLLKHALFKRNH